MENVKAIIAAHHNAACVVADVGVEVDIMAVGIGMEMSKDEVEGKRKAVKSEGEKMREGLEMEKRVREGEVGTEYGGGGVLGSLKLFLGE